MRDILHQPLAALLTAGEPPVVFEEQVCADNLDEVQKPSGTPPSTLVRIEWKPEAEGVVEWVPVLRSGPGLGVDAREILGPLAVRRVGRVRVEADPDLDGFGLAYDFEPGEFVCQ
ncbi:hypothetical protein QBA54_42995 [Streptomyces sp. B21-108]|uniref:hypothetical protein n=1 Tax=Streptomyces sp. B21-108 TaxID=3039419 RepID=UPI002FF0C4EF